jgi:tRNA-uridine 2-sulfurtransferase
MNWIEPPVVEEFVAQVQIRYRSPAVPCVIRLTENNACQVRFNETYPAVTPGQAAVIYREDKLLGGGWIEHAIP